MKKIRIAFLILGIIALGCNSVSNEKNNSVYPIIYGTWSVDGPTHAHWFGQTPITQPEFAGSNYRKNRIAAIDTVFDTVLVNSPKQQGLTLQPNTTVRAPTSLKFGGIEYFYTGFYLKFVDSTKYSYTLKNIGNYALLRFPDWTRTTNFPPIQVSYYSEPLGWYYTNGILLVELDLYQIKGDWDNTGLDKMDLVLTDTAQALGNPRGPRRTRVYRFTNINGFMDALKKMGAK